MAKVTNLDAIKIADQLEELIVSFDESSSYDDEDIEQHIGRLYRALGQRQKPIRDQETPPQSQQNCGNCRFYQGKHCVRRPPAVDFDHLNNIGSYFPQMNENEWCGGWEVVS